MYTIASIPPSFIRIFIKTYTIILMPMSTICLAQGFQLMNTIIRQLICKTGTVIETIPARRTALQIVP